MPASRQAATAQRFAPAGCGERPDLLVVGVGPAGASAAAAAAAAGCRVLALDRRHSLGEPVQCAEFVSDACGIAGLSWDEVTTQRIVRMVSTVEGREPRVSEDFRGRMICRRTFDRALARLATAAGARILTGVAVCGIEATGVRLSNGRLIRPRALLGADGPRSVVGAALGRSNQHWVAARQVTVRLARPDDATEIFLRAAFTGGYAWLFPKGDTANLGLGVDFQHRGRLKSLLQDLQAGLAAAGRVSARPLSLTGGLIPVGARRRAVGRLGAVAVLLAGDAAGLTNPVTGAGIEAAVHSGMLAGRAVASWLDGSPGALAEYESELSDLYDPAQARALRHRSALRAADERGGATAEQLWRGWIASPEYWSECLPAGSPRPGPVRA